MLGVQLNLKVLRKTRLLAFFPSSRCGAAPGDAPPPHATGLYTQLCEANSASRSLASRERFAESYVYERLGGPRVFCEVFSRSCCHRPSPRAVWGSLWSVRGREVGCSRPARSAAPVFFQSSFLRVWHRSDRGLADPRGARVGSASSAESSACVAAAVAASRSLSERLGSAPLRLRDSLSAA